MGKAIEAKNLNIYYGSFLAVEGVNMSIRPQTVTALIGPSGCGKSTFLRSVNRMHEVIPGAHVKGTLELDGKDLYGAGVDPVGVRRQIGMVFQRPNPFPTMSIYDNVVAGLKLQSGRMKRSDQRALDDVRQVFAFTASEFETGSDVVEDRHGGERVRPLEDHADRPPQRDGVDVRAVDVVVVEQHLAGDASAGHDLVQPVEAAQECGFSAAGRADQGGHRLRLDRHRDVLDGLVRAVEAREPDRFDALGHGADHLRLAASRRVSSRAAT